MCLTEHVRIPISTSLQGDNRFDHGNDYGTCQCRRDDDLTNDLSFRNTVSAADREVFLPERGTLLHEMDELREACSGSGMLI